MLYEGKLGTTDDDREGGRRDGFGAKVDRVGWRDVKSRARGFRGFTLPPFGLTLPNAPISAWLGSHFPVSLESILNLAI